MAQPMSSGPSVVDQQLSELERKINVEKKMQLAALQMQEALRSAPNSTSSSTSSLAQPVEPPHWVVKEQQQQQLSSSEAAQMKQIQVTLAESYERTKQLQLEYDRLLQAKANGVKPNFQPSHGKSLSHSQLPTQRYLSSDTGDAGTTLIGDELGEQSGRMLSIKHRSRSMTNLLDASKSDGSLSRIKVLFKINEITKKLEIESRIMAGAEKLLHAHSEQKQLLPDLQHKLKTSQDKIQLLKTSLAKYQKMMLQYPEPGPQLQSADSESDLGPNMHQPANYYKFTGRLKAKVVAANGLVQRKAKSDVYVVVRVDNIERARTKGKAKMIWQEDFDLKMHNAREVEFELYDKSGEILALLFFKIEELEQEIAHRQEVVINLPTTKGLGFAPAHAGSGRSSVEQLDGGLPPTVEVPSDAAGGWYELEPMGQLQIVMKLTALTERDTKEMQRQQRQEGAKSGLKRHAAVKKRRLHIVNGHKFVKQQFYGIMKCAYCGDTLISAGGYQCQDCKYLCHKKCHEKIVTKCISTSSTEMSAQEQRSQDAQVLKHNVPHRFDSTTNFTPVWCCHCGYMLPIGRKGAQKCTECSVHCHATCEIFIPNFCGMSMKMANDLLFHAQMIEKKRKELLQRTEAEKLQRETQVVAEPAVEASQALQKSSSGMLSQDQPTVKLPHKATLEDFHFIAVLGKGNFGKVMLAEEKRTRNLYAIKVLKKEFILENDEVESCKSEKRVFLTANRARHPFLVGLHSCFQTETRIYFVEEYISGGDLMLHIQREQFNEKRAKFYACEVLLALEYFHANGIIYRDLKLDNLLLTLDGHVKVADYGLCKENMWFGKTTNTFCGTPEFMAPEILLEQDYTRAVDWWAFGVLIFEMLLGQSPFRGDDEEEIFEAILEEEVLYPANMTRESVDILKKQKLLMKNPTHRLGYGRADSQEIKDHPFFAGVSWQDVYHKKIPVPFKPTLSHAQDISNFDEEFTREMPILTPVQNALNQADQDEFRGFSYTAGWAASQK